jgi:catechol 2,3-dioxygenase-like lactoylglutathione lyase family enzyme
MKMYIKSVMVDDQQKALDFYTGKLGFTVKHDIPMGEHRWLTVVSPDEPDGVELGLEPDAYPPARTFQAALKADGVPFTAFSVEDLEAEAKRLQAAGVVFTQPPTQAGPAKIAVIDDTCGNLIQLIELPD